MRLAWNKIEVTKRGYKTFCDKAGKYVYLPMKSAEK